MSGVITVLILLLSFFGLFQQNSSNLIFYENFEVPNFAQEGSSAARFSVQKLGQSITSEIQACEGSSVVRFHVDSTLPGYEDRRRSMLMMRPHPDNYGKFGTVGRFDTTIGEEFWYGFAVYVPKEWNTSALVWQEKAGLHYAFYAGDSGVRTELNPTISVHIDSSGNQLRWKYQIKADPKMIKGPNHVVPSKQKYMGVVHKGAWNTVVIHAKYAHNENGKVAFWINGNQYDYVGRTVVAAEGFRDSQRRAANIPYDYADPHNFSFGIYKPDLGDNPTGKQYSLYFDAFRVGNNHSSYAEVAPRCKASIPEQKDVIEENPTEPPINKPCAPLPGTILCNGNFEAGNADWTFHSQNGREFSTTQNAYECRQAAEVYIGQARDNIQFYQTDIALEPNAQYQLSFAAYSSQGNDIGIYLHKHTADYHSYGLAVSQIDLTTEWQLFTIDFATTGFDTAVTDGRLRFWLTPFAQAGDTYWFDQITLSKVADITGTLTTSTINVSSNDNLLQNANFLDAQNHWTFHSDSRGSFTTAQSGYRCGSAAQLQVEQLGNNIQLYQSDVPLEPNTPYRLSFAAYSSQGNDFGVYLHKHTALYNSYGLNVDRIDLTTEWQVYTVDFTTTGFDSPVTDGRLRFWLPSFAQAGDIYWIDHIALTKQSSTTVTDTDLPTEPSIESPTDSPTELPTEPAAPKPGCAVHPETVIRNATFDNARADWGFYTNRNGAFQVVTEGGPCQAAARLDIPDGTNVQLYQQNIILAPNMPYRLSFDAYAQKGNDVAIYLHKQQGNYTNYGLNVERIDLSTNWQHHIIDFVSADFHTIKHDGQLSIWIAGAESAGETYGFDNISIAPLTDSVGAAAVNPDTIDLVHAIYLPFATR